MTSKDKTQSSEDKAVTLHFSPFLCGAAYVAANAAYEAEHLQLIEANITTDESRSPQRLQRHPRIRRE